MSNATETNTSAKKATDATMVVRSKSEGIALCSAFILASVFIVVGNMLTIVLFAVNKAVRKKSLFLVFNMAFADLMLGSVCLPIYIFNAFGADYQLWGVGDPLSLSIIHVTFDTVFSQASLISATLISAERFYAIYWPFKHKTLSMRAYRIVIFVVWTVAFIQAAVWSLLYRLISFKHSVYVWAPYILILLVIVCACNIGIWRKFQRASVASQQQNRASQNKRLTRTLLFVSVLALLSWLPLVIVNFIIYVCHVPIPLVLFVTMNFINYLNSFVNPVVYALRIPEFKQGLASCCLGSQEAAINDDGTPATHLRILQANLSHIQLAFEQEAMDTKL